MLQLINTPLATLITALQYSFDNIIKSQQSTSTSQHDKQMEPFTQAMTCTSTVLISRKGVLQIFITTSNKTNKSNSSGKASQA